LDFFKRHSDADAFAVFGPMIIDDFDHLVRKDIRALSPSVIAGLIESLGCFPSVRILDEGFIEAIRNEKPSIVMPDEDESHQVAQKYLSDFSVVFDSSFLRWDKSRSLKEVPVTSESITSAEFAHKFMGLASTQAQKSSDWWRQVGAVIVKEHQVLVTGFNKHVPAPLTPYVFGDPRGLFSKGVSIELTTALHAEADVIGQAAREGLSLRGASLYVTTFPCPMCARLIAHCGFRECYFSGGYGVLDGEDVLKKAQVRLIRVVHETLPNP
jgi:dCMP deaminase